MATRTAPFQFGLRTLLLTVSLTAVAFGAIRWFGFGVSLFVLAAVGIWSLTRVKVKHWLVWLVPTLWSACALGSWYHPGDEYGLFIASTLAAIWIVFILEPGHLSNVYLLLIAAGAMMMSLLGFILDRLRVPRRPWVLIYILTSVGWFGWMLWQFPTIDEAVAKNGSVLAYAFCGANLGLCVSVLLFLGIGAIMWLLHRVLSEGTKHDDERV